MTYETTDGPITKAFTIKEIEDVLNCFESKSAIIGELFGLPNKFTEKDKVEMTSAARHTYYNKIDFHIEQYGLKVDGKIQIEADDLSEIVNEHIAVNGTGEILGVEDRESVRVLFKHILGGIEYKAEMLLSPDELVLIHPKPKNN